MGGNIIKLLLKSFADLSGITKWNDSVKSSIGNMGQMSRAARMLGATLGATGGAIGRLVGAIAQGSVWGFAAQGISMLIERFDLFGKKAKEAREKESVGTPRIVKAELKGASEKGLIRHRNIRQVDLI